jgi:hypothetical protein
MLAPSIVVCLVVIAFTSTERINGELLTTETFVILLLIGNIVAGINVKANKKNMKAKVNEGIAMAASAVNKFLWFFICSLPIPIIPIVRRAIPPNNKIDRSCSGSDAKMFIASVAVK